jgi:surface antigen
MSDQRDRIVAPRPARTAALTAGQRPRRAGRGRALTASGLPAALAIGGLLPIGAGGSVTQQAARPPSSVLCQGYAKCNGRGYSSHGYGARGWRSYWRMSAGNQCTNYAAFVESTVFHASTPGYLLGNGGQWASTARAHGVTVNRIPAVGAVAEWDGGAPGIGPMRSRSAPPGMIPLVGDWDGDGRDGIGYYDPRNGTFHLRDSPSAGRASYTFKFGPRGMIPLAGNWSGARG